MSAPILLPGDWVYLRISNPLTSVSQTERDRIMKKMADDLTEVYNAMGVYVVGTDQVCGPDVVFGHEIVAVFRNGVTPVNGKAPGL